MNTAALMPGGLDEIEAQVWGLLEAGVRSHRAPFHSGVVANMGVDGPSARTVILRSAVTTTRRLHFHTDRRAAKFAALAADPRLSWTFYDEPLRLQLRLWGTAVLHADDDFADAQWRATGLNSRRNYHAFEAPGARLAQPTGVLPAELDDARWTLAFSENARPNFAAVETIVTRLEALYLHHAGHRRAEFRYAADGQRSAAHWLVP